jgi:two-component system response regulator NreC
MFAAGARGYVLKQSATTELIRAVRTVAGGQQFIDPAIERPADASPASVAATNANDRAGDQLTPQEETVLRLVACSRSNAEIAQQLAISPAEAVALKSAAMRKAGLLTRVQVMAYARAQGWADPR